jgi:amidohydrolase
VPPGAGPRRDLHRNAELAFDEHETAACVAEHLTSRGLSVRTGVGGTGVLADLDGAAPGPRLLIRADMDALPIVEQSGREFASVRGGAMHACGHDAHVAATVGAATVLAELRDQIAGSVRFCFQPAEETLSGAEAVINDGALEQVDRVLGAHVLSTLPCGTILNPPGPVLVGADFFEIIVHSRAGHAGMLQSTIDPVLAASQLVSTLQSIVSRETAPKDLLILSITAINGGSAPNIITDRVVLQGNIRWLTEEIRQRALERIRSVTTDVCSALRATGEFTVTASAPVSVNGRADVEVIDGAIRATGRAVAVRTGYITASDDWSRYIERVPGAFFLVGAGGLGAAGHHSPSFDIDETAIGLMCEVFVQTALAHLTPQPLSIQETQRGGPFRS